MKYLSIIILSFGLLLSCKKPKDRVEKREDENIVQELVYRNDSLVQATNFTKNGKLEYEGEVSIINDKKYRRGWWIFYTKEGKAELMLEFINEGKIEIENQRIVIDVNNQTIKKNNSHFFEKKIIEKNKDSIKVNIKYFSPDTILGNILYIRDEEGNELKQVKSKTKGYDWDITISSKAPTIRAIVKTKNGKGAKYYYETIK